MTEDLPLPVDSPEDATPGRAPGVLNTPQRAVARFRAGKRFAARAEVEVTPAGLLSIGGMVGMILLGSAVIVAAVGRRGGAAGS